ncbi:MAG TPA: glycerol-3-phosphate dehydrogenase/oxidase [Candidatus Angelobacter sp.]|nr:glycerol-3-phosphate dehydrogenase/oxidase [Candidatus Angelobacter sp.]
MRHRAEELQDIAGQSFDLCVIGGGATGAGCALDAQLRGLRTVLLEAADFAGATSSAATKIIHGGVRYLEEAIKDVDPKEYHVVVRALHERVRMLDNAPHLTRTLEFLVPSFRWLDVAYLDIGLKIYDWLAGSARISPSKFVTREETLRRMPQLKRDGLLGSVEYSDGQFDDARYNLALVHSFADAGGRVLNYCRVTDFRRNSARRLSGVTAVDQVSGATVNLDARAIVNATGPASDSVRQMASPSAPKRMRLSKGSHILFPLDLFPTDDAMLVPKTEAGSVLFAVPWGDRLLVGTTEREAAAGDDLYVTEEETTYMLRQLNQYLAKPLQASDIVSGFAGARPLVSSGESENTQKIARDDVIEVDPKSGLISIMGGKWTTHRAMAEDTINAVQKSLGIAVSECPTRNHVLHGGEGFTSDLWEKLMAVYPISKETARHLAAKFGTASRNVLELTRAESSLAQPLIPGSAQIQAEAVYAVREELSATIEDVISRRIGLQYYSWRDAIKAAPVVGSLMARELQWTGLQEHQAVTGYVERINFLLERAGLQTEANPVGHISAA